MSATVLCSSAEALDTSMVGGRAKRWTGADRCRGAKVQADRDAVLMGFDLLARRAGGVEMDFMVYESETESGSYRRLGLATSSRRGSTGTEFDWEQSPPLYAQMREGRYYVVLACWGREGTIGYRGEPAIGPTRLGFGRYIGGVGYSKSGAPPASIAWSTDTNDYLARLRTTPGEALVADTRAGYDGPFEPGRYGKARGNVYAVKRGVDLVGFDQLFHVDPDVMDGKVEWYVYKCTRRAACVNGSPSWSRMAGGKIDVVGGPLNADRWLGVEGIRVKLRAGQTYWIGFSWHDPRMRAYRFTAPEVAPSWGRYVGNAYAMPLPLAEQQAFRARFNSALPQHLLTVERESTGLVEASNTQN